MTTEVANAVKTIIDPNLITFVDQIVDAAKEGWQVDPTNPPMLRGFSYHTVMLMPENEVPEPTLSRAEILANARAAKAAKKVADAPAQDAE